MKRWTIVVVVLLAGLAWAGDKRYADLTFTVVRATNEQPIRNAAVVLHPVDKNGHAKKGDLELKTNGDGEASIEGVHYGTLRVQVIAQGFQTFGEDYEINESSKQIVIKLNRPVAQYSTYEDHPADKASN